MTKDYSYLWTGKKENIDPMWKVLNKEVDLGQQHHPLIMYTWDVLKDNVK